MKTQIFLKMGLLLILCACPGPFAFAQNKSILYLADQYSSALKKFQSQKRRTSIEGMFRKGKAVGEKLDEMESLTENDYARLEKKMKGFVINRSEVVFIEPEVKFFGGLARRYGTPADIAFFVLLREIKPDSVWAAYIEQQTDVTGCTIYGNGLLTGLYGKALRFKRAYPKGFVKDINDEISEILQAFSESGCACGSMNGVQREFRLFIKTFPKDKKTPEIKKNLKDIIDRGDFRFNCKSG